MTDPTAKGYTASWEHRNEMQVEECCERQLTEALRKLNIMTQEARQLNQAQHDARRQFTEAMAQRDEARKLAAEHKSTYDLNLATLQRNHEIDRAEWEPELIERVKVAEAALAALEEKYDSAKDEWMEDLRTANEAMGTRHRNRSDWKNERADEAEAKLKVAHAALLALEMDQVKFWKNNYEDAEAAKVAAIAQRDAARKEREESIAYAEEAREDIVDLTADLNKVRADYTEVVRQRDMHACNAVEMMRQKEKSEAALATERARVLQAENDYHEIRLELERIQK
jgi:hypothetical protein